MDAIAEPEYNKAQAVKESEKTMMTISAFGGSTSTTGLPSAKSTRAGAESNVFDQSARCPHRTAAAGAKTARRRQGQTLTVARSGLLPQRP